MTLLPPPPPSHMPYHQWQCHPTNHITNDDTTPDHQPSAWSPSQPSRLFQQAPTPKQHLTLPPAVIQWPLPIHHQHCHSCIWNYHPFNTPPTLNNKPPPIWQPTCIQKQTPALSKTHPLFHQEVALPVYEIGEPRPLPHHPSLFPSPLICLYVHMYI